MVLRNVNLDDRILGLQQNDDYNFFSKLGTDDEEIIINPYENIDIKCRYFNVDETIKHLKSKKGLSILSWNIWSLKKKFNQFKDFINIFNLEGCFFDIIALQEVWCIKNSDFFNIEGYNLIYKSRQQTEGGGVCFYINKQIPYKELKKLSTFEEKLFESITLELDIGKKDKLIVSNVYRSNCNHPSLTQNDQVDRFIEIFSDLQAKLSNLKPKSYIMGDLNLDLLKFEQHEKTRALLENSFTNGFLELISLPTRVTNTSATLIDHFYTNDTNCNYDSSIILSEISDHFPLCNIILEKEREVKNVYFYTQNFSEENITSFKQEMSMVDWNFVLNQNETQSAYENFYEKFNESYQRHFPHRKVKFNKNIHNVEPFMSKAILKSRKTKLNLAEIKIRFPTQANKDKYNAYNKCYNKVIRTAKKLYFQRSFEEHKSDLRKTWEVLREAIRKTNDKSNIINEIFVNGTSYSGGQDISNKFNEYFTSVADNITNNINPSNRDCTYYLRESNSIFSFDQLYEHDLVRIVKGLESKSSQDMLGISNKFVKKVIDVISNPLTYIINLSLQTGFIPKELKMAKVIPIFKLKTKEADLLANMTNYRPISLLPIFSKILEKVVSLQLSDYLEDNNLLFKHQYGFQKKKSTVQPIIHFLQEIVQNSNDKNISIGVFCDLQKAFDCCSHRILLIKLSKLGVKDRELKWFENYLKNRQQFVNVNDKKSNIKFISKGVPQGSILGPLLFLIYINDLAKCTNLFTLLFADDTSFIIHGKNINDIIEILNIELKKISYWFRTNELSLHPDKTKFMIFTKNESNIDFDNINIVVNHNNDNQDDHNLITRLTYVNSNSETPAIKFLGVFLDPKLNFKYHIDMIHNKISRSLYAINAVKHFIGKKALKTLYSSLVHSHLSYCIPIWGCAAKTNLKKLEIQQKKAVRIISQSRYNAHTVPIFQDFEILPITEQAKYSKLLIMYDFVHHRLPCSFDNLWIRNNVRAERVLRNGRLFNIPFVRLESYKDFPFSDLPRLWNNIVVPNTNPNPINNVNIENNEYIFQENMSRKQFCKQLKHFLIVNLELVCNRENCPECL
jgi:hypothetical protein